MNKAVIVGTGAYAPERIIPNSWFNEQLGEDVDTWLQANVEIYERRWCAENQSAVDLCEQAALMALQNANISADKLNMVIVATDTPEYVSPSTAAVLQHRIQAVNAGSFDVNSACAGFVSAIDTASKYIQSDNSYEYILVVGAYAMSKYLNLHDKKTVTLFADGAGAVVLKSEIQSDSGYIAGYQISKGEYHDWMGIYAGGTKHPLTQQVLDNKEHLLQFVKKFPKELNPKMWVDITNILLSRAELNVTDIKQFVLTQINVHAIRETLDLLVVSRDLAITNMHHFGYTGSAAIPMALHRAVTEQKIKKGDPIILIGSGGGLSFAGAILKY